MNLEELLAALKGLTDAEREKVLENLGSKNVDALLNKIRSDEKNKLSTSLTKKEKEIAELKAELTKAQEAINGSSTESAQTIQMLEQQKDLMAQQFQEMTNTFMGALKQQELKTARAELLNRYKGEIVPELIAGDSEAELEQSALIAHRKYKEYEAHFAEKYASTQKPAETPPQEQTPAQPVNPLLKFFSKEQVDALTAAGLLPDPNAAAQGPNKLGQVPASAAPANLGLANFGGAMNAHAAAQVSGIPSTPSQQLQAQMNAQQSIPQMNVQGVPNVNPGLQGAGVQQKTASDLLNSNYSFEQFKGNRADFKAAAKELLTSDPYFNSNGGN